MESLNIIEIACSRKYEDFYQEIGKSFAKGSFGHCFKVQIKNRLEQRGLLKRFSVTCYGKQQTLEDIREEKVKIYDKVKNNELSRKSRLYNMNFFRYIPKEGFRKTIKYKFSKTKANNVKTRRFG